MIGILLSDFSLSICKPPFKLKLVFEIIDALKYCKTLIRQI